MSIQSSGHPLMRKRNGQHARVTYEELFFDLVYVFAVTQLSHSLLHHLTLTGALQTLILWFSVWLGWQYTCWVTNWFDPERPAIRRLIFATMLGGLIMAAAIPDAFGTRGLLFAGAYTSMQVGRTAFIVIRLERDHALSANYQRMLGWVSISAVLWLAGGLAERETRTILWLAAVLCEYVSPMFGFALPILGRSHTRDWTIEGGHLAERCQLFVIVALGEAVLATGASLSGESMWKIETLSAFLSTFVGALAMWWLYFGTSSKDASAAIAHSNDPGRMGAYFHYVHAILVAGIIVTAVGNDLVLTYPDTRSKFAYTIALVAGPAIYILGSAIYKRIVYGVIPRSHIASAIALGGLAICFGDLGTLEMGWATTVVLLVASWWETRVGRQQYASQDGSNLLEHD
ncbi:MULTISPECIES: low temperature requirement protein A [unclassified Burkholderia]|uniref:low temperature requirement protein A n=1 Tax=unclassified Burkholderia TaxID=2613784 RepID=UPI00197E48FB|nr:MULTISPECIES: low temperature requirement protein A [unclassified Burkholderia]